MHLQIQGSDVSHGRGSSVDGAGAVRRGRSGTSVWIFAALLAGACQLALPAQTKMPVLGETGKSGAPVKLPAIPDGKAPATTPATTPTTTATLSTLLFDFGNNLVNNKMTQTAVMVTNTGGAILSLHPALSGDASYAIVTAKSCGATLAAGKSCDFILTYKPTAASYPKSQDATLNMHFGNIAAGVPDTVAITGVSAALKVGSVAGTGNPNVAQYTMTLPFPGRMKVLFGETTAYGFRTWTQDTDVNHGVISIYVAGMKQNTHYHMAAQVTLNNGIVAMDVDHVFKTGVIPTTGPYALGQIATTASGQTPQPGIEMTNPLNSLQAFDLEGNLLWWYLAPTPYEDYLQGAKMLPNGDILIALGVLNNMPLNNPITPENVIEIREIDLAGNTIRELSATDLNAALQTAPASCTECRDSATVPLTLQTFHHEITPLPNGHWLILTNEIRALSATSTPPLTNEAKQNVIGDVVVDVDENLQPVWVWNEFNHLDANRHPYSFPDWTHSNAIVYSPTDGNFLVSMRHQNWVVKVDYKNGRGKGDILWHLGYGGDFKLVGGTSPTDWQYAQHMPNFFSENTSGVFSLGLMDNGDDRLYPAGSKCTPQGSLPKNCLYSTIPVFKIDETAKTATLTFHQKIDPTEYSNFGGNTQELPNGNVEYDLCGIGTTSLVREVTQDKSATTVWSMTTATGNFYRAWRIGSLYPGVTW